MGTQRRVVLCPGPEAFGISDLREGEGKNREGLGQGLGFFPSPLPTLFYPGSPESLDLSDTEGFECQFPQKVLSTYMAESSVSVIGITILVWVSVAHIGT